MTSTPPPNAFVGSVAAPNLLDRSSSATAASGTSPFSHSHSHSAQIATDDLHSDNATSPLPVQPPLIGHSASQTSTALLQQHPQQQHQQQQQSQQQLQPQQQQARQRRSIACFSGGSAMNSFVSVVQSITDDTAYIMPVSDDGGSTSEIIRVLGGPGIGDLRSRLVRLADTKGSEARAVHDLLCYRLPIDPPGSFDDRGVSRAKVEWMEIVSGTHRLWRGISPPYKETIRAFLAHFYHETVRAALRSQFDFQGGSIGNFFLTGSRLFFGNLDAAIFQVARIMRIAPRTVVLPVLDTVRGDVAISALLRNGAKVHGQCEISHPGTKVVTKPQPPDTATNEYVTSVDVLKHSRSVKQSTSNLVFSKDTGGQALSAPIRRVYYTNYEKYEVYPMVNTLVADHLKSKNSIIYGCGSLYTSIIPCLIVPGIAHIIACKGTIPKSVDVQTMNSNLYGGEVNMQNGTSSQTTEGKNVGVGRGRLGQRLAGLDTAFQRQQTGDFPSSRPVSALNGNATSSYMGGVGSSRFKKILLLNGSQDRETEGFTALDFILAITDALNYSYLVKEALEETDEYRNHEHIWEADGRHHDHNHRYYHHIPRSSPTDNAQSSVDASFPNHERSNTDSYQTPSGISQSNSFSRGLNMGPSSNSPSRIGGLGSQTSLSGISVLSGGKRQGSNKVPYYQLLAGKYRREAKRWLESSERKFYENSGSGAESGSGNDDILRVDFSMGVGRGLDAPHIAASHSAIGLQEMATQHHYNLYHQHHHHHHHNHKHNRQDGHHNTSRSELSPRQNKRSSRPASPIRYEADFSNDVDSKSPTSRGKGAVSSSFEPLSTSAPHEDTGYLHGAGNKLGSRQLNRGYMHQNPRHPQQNSADIDGSHERLSGSSERLNGSGNGISRSGSKSKVTNDGDSPCPCDVCRAIDERAPIQPWNTFVQDAFMESECGREYLVYPNPPHKYITHMVYPENGHLLVDLERISALRIECIKVPFIRESSAGNSTSNAGAHSTNYTTDTNTDTGNVLQTMLRTRASLVDGPLSGLKLSMIRPNLGDSSGSISSEISIPNNSNGKEQKTQIRPHSSTDGGARNQGTASPAVSHQQQQKSTESAIYMSIDVTESPSGLSRSSSICSCMDDGGGNRVLIDDEYDETLFSTQSSKFPPMSARFNNDIRNNFEDEDFDYGEKYPNKDGFGGMGEQGIQRSLTFSQGNTTRETIKVNNTMPRLTSKMITQCHNPNHRSQSTKTHDVDESGNDGSIRAFSHVRGLEDGASRLGKEVKFPSTNAINPRFLNKAREGLGSGGLRPDKEPNVKGNIGGTVGITGENGQPNTVIPEDCNAERDSGRYSMVGLRTVLDLLVT